MKYFKRSMFYVGVKLLFSFLLVPFLLSSYTVSGQAPLRFNHLTSDQGLNSSYTECLFQDHLGFLWIGTNGGINRFDGVNIISYEHDLSDTSSLICNDINCIFEDDLHQLWIGTTAGLSILRPGSSTFINYGKINNISDTIDFSNGVQSINQYDHKIWIVTHNRIYVSPDSLVQFQTVFDKLKTPENKTVYFLFTPVVATSSGIWFLSSIGPVMTKDGINFYHKYNDPEHIPLFSHEFISAMVNDGDSILYCSTFDFPGLIKYDIKNLRMDSIPFLNPVGNEGLNTISLCQSNEHEIWGSSMAQGIFKFDIKTKLTKFYHPEKSNPYSLNTDQSFQIAADKKGSIFVATERGLNYANPLQPPFQIFNISNTDIAGESLAITEGKDGVLWLATLDNGLFSFDPQSKTIEHFTLPSEYNGISTMSYSDNQLLMSTSGGLCTFSTTTKIFKPLLIHDVSFQETMIRDPALFIFHDKTGAYWLGTYLNGVFKINIKTGEYLHFSNKEPMHLLPSRAINCATWDENENLWIGYQTNDIAVINTNDNSILKLKVPKINGSETIAYIESLQSDKQGHIWISINQVGLFKYNILTQAYIRYDTRDGLSSNVLGSIEIDQSHNLWVATSNGLNKIDQESDTILLYNASDGLYSNQFNTTPMFAARDGRIYIWSDNSILYFYPDQLYSNPYNPSLVLMSFKKSGVQFNITPIDHLINFTYKDKMITFDFFGINFIDPTKTQYAYFLENFDDTWNFIGSQPNATFSTLPPGDYTLHLKATNKPNMWDVPETLMKVHVSGPIWRKWWFVFSCFCLGLAVVYGANQYRFSQFKKILTIRNRISKDLHDDIGSTLSSISINSTAIQQMKPENFPEVISTVTNIGQNARIAMENMSDIVWAINPANDTFRNLMARLQVFSIQLLEAKDIQLQFDIPEALQSIKLSMPQRKNIYLILREAIHNVAKYSQASHCLVSAKLENKKIDLEVKDNGVGISQIIPGLGGNGMINMQARADELKARFQVHSEKEKGTRVSLQIAYT